MNYNGKTHLSKLKEPKNLTLQAKRTRKLNKKINDKLEQIKNKQKQYQQMMKAHISTLKKQRILPL